MRLAFAHGSDKDRVRRLIADGIAKALDKHGARLSKADYAWSGDTMTFVVGAMGTTLRGTVEVTEEEVIVDVGIPLMLRPFEGQARTRIAGALEELLGDSGSDGSA